MLTRDHALGAVAAAHLGLTDPVIDATSVLAWTADPAVSTGVADLRALAGDALAGAVLDWAAERAGAAGPRCGICCAPGKPATRCRSGWSPACWPGRR